MPALVIFDDAERAEPAEVRAAARCTTVGHGEAQAAFRVVQVAGALLDEAGQVFQADDLHRPARLSGVHSDGGWQPVGAQVIGGDTYQRGDLREADGGGAGGCDHGGDPMSFSMIGMLRLHFDIHNSYWKFSLICDMETKVPEVGLRS